MSEKEKPGNSPGSSGEKKKQNPGVKLDPVFHKKLKFIADNSDIEMGKLIEREMADFVEREFEDRTTKLKQKKSGEGS